MCVWVLHKMYMFEEQVHFMQNLEQVHFMQVHFMQNGPAIR